MKNNTPGASFINNHLADNAHGNQNSRRKEKQARL